MCVLLLLCLPCVNGHVCSGRIRCGRSKTNGTDGTAYTDGTAGLVADGIDSKDVSAQ